MGMPVYVVTSLDVNELMEQDNALVATYRQEGIQPVPYTVVDGKLTSPLMQRGIIDDQFFYEIGQNESLKCFAVIQIQHMTDLDGLPKELHQMLYDQAYLVQSDEGMEMRVQPLHMARFHVTEVPETIEDREQLLIEILFGPENEKYVHDDEDI